MLSEPRQLISSANMVVTAMSEASQNVFKSKTWRWKYSAIILITKLETRKAPDPSQVLFNFLPNILMRPLYFVTLIPRMAAIGSEMARISIGRMYKNLFPVRSETRNVKYMASGNK